MENIFEINGSKIYKNKEHFIDINGIAEAILVFENYIILLLVPNSADIGRNVVCYNFDKKLIWQIEEPYKIHATNFYSSIYLKGNDLFAYNENGFEAQINIFTGKILNNLLIR